jgi:hypothetical protein
MIAGVKWQYGGLAGTVISLARICISCPKNRNFHAAAAGPAGNLPMF